LFVLLKFYKKSLALNYKKKIFSTINLNTLRGRIKHTSIKHTNKARKKHTNLNLKSYNTRRITIKSLYKNVGYASFKNYYYYQNKVKNLNNLVWIRKLIFLYFFNNNTLFGTKKCVLKPLKNKNLSLNFNFISIKSSLKKDFTTPLSLTNTSLKYVNKLINWSNRPSYKLMRFNTYGYDYVYYFTYRREFKLQYPFSIRYVLTAVNFSNPDPQKIWAEADTLANWYKSIYFISTSAQNKTKFFTRKMLNFNFYNTFINSSLLDVTYSWYNYINLNYFVMQLIPIVHNSLIKDKTDSNNTILSYPSHIKTRHFWQKLKIQQNYTYKHNTIWFLKGQWFANVKVTLRILNLLLFNKISVNKYLFKMFSRLNGVKMFFSRKFLYKYLLSKLKKQFKLYTLRFKAKRVYQIKNNRVYKLNKYKRIISTRRKRIKRNYRVIYRKKKTAYNLYSVNRAKHVLRNDYQRKLSAKVKAYRHLNNEFYSDNLLLRFYSRYFQEFDIKNYKSKLNLDIFNIHTSQTNTFNQKTSSPWIYLKNWQFFLQTSNTYLYTIFFNPLLFKYYKYLNPLYSYFNMWNLYFANKKQLHTNLIPNSSFRSYVKTRSLRMFGNNSYRKVVAFWYYATLVRFIQFVFGSYVLFQFFPFLDKMVHVSFVSRYQLWMRKLNYFERRLGHRFFLEEGLHIIHMSFYEKDVKLIHSWLTAIITRISFWKTRFIFRFIKYIFLNHFQPMFADLNAKGFKIKLKGKISVAGNSRKRTILFRAGKNSHTNLNLRVLHHKNTIVTFTGVMGFQIWIFY